jgi:DNA-binding response OmpR family regulator
MAKILIVEDEEDLQTLLELALTRAGYEVYISPNGVDALYQAQYYKPDLILLDLMMPWASGDAVLGFVRSTEELEKTRVLVLSAHANGAQIAEQLNADGFLAKPAEMKTIISTIGGLLTKDTPESA